MTAVDVRDLVVRYGEVTAVDGLTFSAGPGEVVAVLGPNGAGKTSTVETLEGYRKPWRGQVRVLGMDPRTDRRRLAPRMGVMLQQGGVYPALAPRDVLRLFAAYFPDPLPPHELLARTGLEDVATTPWRRLSGGEQQRLSLALALVGQPEVVFLDEPTAGIDPHGRRLVRDEMRRLRDDGVCVLVTTHELEEAERTADRVVIIDQGRLVADGPPEQLMAAAAGEHILFRAPPGLDVVDLGATLGGPAAEERPGEYRLDVAATPANVAALTAWLADRDMPLADLRAGRQRLEDVFLRLTGGSGGLRPQ